MTPDCVDAAHDQQNFCDAQHWDDDQILLWASWDHVLFYSYHDPLRRYTILRDQV
jgi:hypothetical protein